MFRERSVVIGYITQQLTWHLTSFQSNCICDWFSQSHVNPLRLHCGLYSSTSCCISHGRGQFSTPTAPRPLNRFSWNLKYITTSRTWPRTQNFSGLCQRGWSGKIVSLTLESFCPFFSFLRHAHRSHPWTHPHAQYLIIRRSRQEVPFGVRKMKFDPLYPQKRKNWDFKAGGQWKIVVVLTLERWTSSNLVQGLTTQVALRDLTPKVKRSRSRNVPNKIAITQYWVGLSSSYLGANMRTTSQWVRLRMVAMATLVA